jgi:S1-C subfamily serine protease
LSGLLVTLDYPAKKVTFRRGALPEADGREIFGWDRSTGLPEIPANVAGQTVMVHLDSGSSGGVAFPTELAKKLPLDGPLVDTGFAKAVDHVRPIQSAPLKGTFTIGRYTLDHPRLSFFDIAKDKGNVGAAVLSQFSITIDPANARLRLAGPADGRLQVVETSKPRYGIQLDKLEASPVTVHAVDAGSRAEKAGMRAGDQILKMNGRDIAELSVDDRLKALGGSPLALTVKRGGATVDLKMTLD